MNRFNFNDGYQRPFDLQVIKDEQIVVGARFKLNPEGRTYNLTQHLSNDIYQDILPEFIVVTGIHDGGIIGIYGNLGKPSLRVSSIKKFYETY